MGQITSQNRRRGFHVGAAILALALAACSGPAPSGQASSPGTSGPGTSTPTPASPATSVSATPDATLDTAMPDSGSSAAASAAPGDGGLGGFGSIAEACGAVSAAVLSGLVLPMAAATGKDTGDVEKAKEALAKMQGQVPADLKDSFDKLTSIADDAGQDLSKLNTEEYDKAIARIDTWLQAHC